MRILAVVANFGTRNDHHAHKLVEEYRGMPETHVVILSNIPKSFGHGVEVVVKTPVGDPWTFPFAHRQILADRSDDYDLFIYSEDDTLITKKNIDAFLRATSLLRPDEIAGFMRSEQGSDGQLYISTAHSHFHWDPASVVARGGELFASFTNEHSGSYVLTQSQLKQAIRSGGFLVEPHRERYDYLVSAATDPYTQCGLKKMVCISNIDNFLLPHLANKYIGSMGLEERLFRRQLSALSSIHRGGLPSGSLLTRHATGDADSHSKSYYERSTPELLSLIPSKVKTLLSYGCGWGALEASLAERGIQVTAVPLDSVIGSCVEGKGIELITADADTLMMSLSGRQFDAIVVSNMLHLVSEPAHLLAWFRRLLSPEGILVARLANPRRPSTLWREFRSGRRSTLSAKEAGTAILRPSYMEVRRWLKTSRFRIQTAVPCVPQRAQALYRLTGRLSAPLLASEFLVAASRSREHGS